MRVERVRIRRLGDAPDPLVHEITRDRLAAVLGQKSPQQAMDDLVAKVKPMLPAK